LVAEGAAEMAERFCGRRFVLFLRMVGLAVSVPYRLHFALQLSVGDLDWEML